MNEWMNEWTAFELCSALTQRIFESKALLHQIILLMHKIKSKQILLYSDIPCKVLTPLFQANTVVLVISQNIELINKHLIRGPNNCMFWAMIEAEGEVGRP